jgi:hypothetical protein
MDPEAVYKRARKHRPRGKGGKGKNKDKGKDSFEMMDEDRASPEPKEGNAANTSNPFGKKRWCISHLPRNSNSLGEEIHPPDLERHTSSCAEVHQVVGKTLHL